MQQNYPHTVNIMKFKEIGKNRRFPTLDTKIASCAQRDGSYQSIRGNINRT